MDGCEHRERTAYTPVVEVCLGCGESFGGTIFERMKARINFAIDEIGKQMPEAAEYLRKHVVFDEQRGTVAYTGDDRIKISLPQGAPGPAGETESPSANDRRGRRRRRGRGRA